MQKIIILAILCFSVLAQMPTIGTFKNFTGMNPIACIADSAKFVQSAKVLADQIVVNVSDYKSIVNDINGVLTIVEKLLPDCGINADLSDTLIGFITYSNSSECIADIEQVVGAIAKVSEDLNNQDFSDLLQDGIKLIQIAEQTINDCKGSKATLLKQTLNTTAINMTWCMVQATQMVAQVQLAFSENNTALNFTHHANHIFNTINATYQIFVAECGLQFVQNFIQVYAPIDCLVQARNSAISLNNVAQGFQQNPFGVFTDMSNAMTSFNNMKVVCPILGFLNQTQPTLAASAPIM